LEVYDPGDDYVSFTFEFALESSHNQLFM